MVPNFSRPSKRSSQPACYAFIDNPEDERPYPHIHAICWVPERLEAGFQAWCRKPCSTLIVEDLRPADDTLAHTRDVVAYASKYMRRRALSDDGVVLAIELPDKSRISMAQKTLG